MAPRGLGPRGRDAVNRYTPTPDNEAGIPEYGGGAYNPVGIRALIGSGADFGPYVLDQASAYYQGPTKSTRVKAHQFVPMDPDIWEKAEQGPLSKQFDSSIRGYIYVKFIKKGNVWKYGPCTLADYRTFRESASKGRSVTYLEVFGHGPSPDGILEDLF